jgi:hypothetical protein
MHRQNIVFLGGLFLVILIVGMLFSNTVRYNIEGLESDDSGSSHSPTDVSGITTSGTDSVNAEGPIDTTTTTINSTPGM